MLINHITEAAVRRIRRHTFKHQCGGTIGQRAINNVAVTGNPAYVSRTPVHVTFFVIEDVLMGHRGIHHVTAGGVLQTFRRTGGT